MTDKEEVLLKQQVEDIHDALIGTYDKPGALRTLERIGRDMYEGPDSVIETMKAYKNDRRWILGAAAVISVIGPFLLNWIKELFTKP